MAKVLMTQAAVNQLEGINEPIHQRILKLLERLEKWPEVSGIKRLSGNLAGKWRLRTGDYRLVFRVDESSATAVVIVERIGLRRDVYKE